MGRVMVAGGCIGMNPFSGIQAGSLSVGSVVKLMEDGTAAEYLVANQGIPGNSSVYDSSCDGTWLLRKNILSQRAWDSGSGDDGYSTSTINTWLNGDFFNRFGAAEQAAIKPVNIPYYSMSLGNPIFKLTCKVFLLSLHEVGRGSASQVGLEGARLDYFTTSTGTPTELLIAYLNGSATEWWLRSLQTDDHSKAYRIDDRGGYYYISISELLGIRPALILPKTAQFDRTTLTLKGAA